MRIISGTAKGRKILSPESMETRPTLDRIKQSIFNIIQTRVYGSTVADIFSGTGSLGLEAASRGADHCYLVDKSKIAYKNLKENVLNLKFTNCTSLNMDAYEALKYFKKDGVTFDIIFVDPPYAKDMIPPAIKIIYDEELLKEDGIIVSKIDSSEEIFNGYKNLRMYDNRRYGNTMVCLYRYEEEKS